MSTTKNRVAVLGPSRLAQDWVALCREKGLDADAVSEPGRLGAPALVIDTGIEHENTRRAALSQLDAALPPSTVVLASCLRFSTTEMACWIERPERLVGYATFYPLAERKIVEVAAGLKTSDAALQQAQEHLKLLDKEAVPVKDAPGLIFPRILSLIINEAARSLEEGVATAEEIDIAMRLGVNYPAGPLRWADRIGLDEVLAVLEGLQRETGDDRYRPAPLLKKLALAGLRGEISGRGFYSYSEERVKL